MHSGHAQSEDESDPAAQRQQRQREQRLRLEETGTERNRGPKELWNKTAEQTLITTPFFANKVNCTFG
jgi:hypothetical protein